MSLSQRNIKTVEVTAKRLSVELLGGRSVRFPLSLLPNARGCQRQTARLGEHAPRHLMNGAVKAFGIFLLVVPSAMSCDLCAVYNASAARGESSAGFHLALAQQFTHSGTLQHEGSEVSDPIGQFRDSSISTLIVGYNFNERFGVSLNLPYIHRTFKRAEGFEVERGTESGLGDIALLGRFSAFRKAAHEYSVSVSLLGGIESPTGDSDRLREERDEVEVPGAPPSGVHGNDLALGSGSFDGLIGAAANARWRRQQRWPARFTSPRKKEMKPET